MVPEKTIQIQTSQPRGHTHNLHHTSTSHTLDHCPPAQSPRAGYQTTGSAPVPYNLLESSKPARPKLAWPALPVPSCRNPKKGSCLPHPDPSSSWMTLVPAMWPYLLGLLFLRSCENNKHLTSRWACLCLHVSAHGIKTNLDTFKTLALLPRHPIPHSLRRRKREQSCSYGLPPALC